MLKIREHYEMDEKQLIPEEEEEAVENKIIAVLWINRCIKALFIFIISKAYCFAVFFNRILPMLDN